MTKPPKDLAELGALRGVEAIRAARGKLEALAVVPPPLSESPPSGVAFNEFVDLEAGSKVPTFPLEALPGWMAEWAEEAARVEQVPVDIAATLALNAAVVATMGKAKVDLFGGEPLNGYFILVDRPGANKSGIFKRATAPIWQWWNERDRRHEHDLCEWRARADKLEEGVKAQKSRLAPRSGDKDSRELEAGDAEEALKEAYQRQADHEREKPRGDLAVCQDVTPEKLADLLAESRCVAALSPEGAEVFDGLGRYQRSENMEVFLKAWNADPLIVDRKGGTKIRVEDPTLTIVAMAQPKVLEGLRDPEGKRDGRGLIARFFWCIPRSLVGYRTYEAREWNEGVRSRFEQELKRLCGLPFPSGECPRIGLEGDAVETFREFYTETERELRRGGDLADIEATASKMRSHLARLAGWLHLADGKGVDTSIDEPTMKRAVDLARYFLAHGIVAYRMMDGPDDDTRAALTLFAKARQGASEGGDGCPAIPLRELAKKVKGKTFPDTAAVEAKLAVLEAHGYTRTIDRKPRGKLVLLNPEVPETPEGAGRAPAGSR
jgi:hypothetical protein